MRRGPLVLLALLACSPRPADVDAATQPPEELTEVDHLRLENAVLREMQTCRPVQEQSAALVRELERRYHFSVKDGDALDNDLKKIVRKTIATTDGGASWKDTQRTMRADGGARHKVTAAAVGGTK